MSWRARVSNEPQPTAVTASATTTNARNAALQARAVKMEGMRRMARAAAAILAGCTGLAWSQDGAPTSSPGSPRWSFPAASPSEPTWRLLVSPYTIHFTYNPDHKNVFMLGWEQERSNGVVWGGAVFDNSFGQPSVYAFGGQRLYRWSPWDALYAEWTVGILYGYTGEYKHKVPLNVGGFSPGAVAGLGWKFTPKLAGQLNILGTSGLMFQLSVDLP